jgi:PPOX class probable F420-dependent enzyme
MTASDTDALDDAKYVSLTTFRRDGRAVAAPVWVVRHDDGWACTTGADSGKVKRLRHTPAVEIVPCDVRGRVADGAPTFRGTARLADGEEYRRVRSSVIRKYRVLGPLLIGWSKVTSLFGKSAAEIAVVWTIDEAG